MNASITLFVSYAHNDEKHRELLDKHLVPLQRRKIIDAWHDRKIEAGQQWADEIDENLNKADIILLLISPNFLSSPYCSNIELNKAMERHKARESRVIPIILEPCAWRYYDFGQLQAFPKDGKAIALWTNENEAFLDVAEGIRQVAEDLFEQRKKKLEEKAGAEQQYKTKVAEALSDGWISPLEQRTLNELRDKLGLTPEEAEEIKNKVYQPIKEYQNQLDKYKNDLSEAIAREYPLSERTKADLKQRHRDLGVREEDAKKIEEPILAEAEARSLAHKGSEAAQLRQQEAGRSPGMKAPIPERQTQEEEHQPSNKEKIEDTSEPPLEYKAKKWLKTFKWTKGVAITIIVFITLMSTYKYLFLSPINILLEQGRAALDAGKLTEPEGDNAAEYIGQILPLTPNDQQARQLPEVIIKHLIGEGDVALSEGDLDKASTNRDQAQALVGQYRLADDELRDFTQRLDIATHKASINKGKGPLAESHSYSKREYRPQKKSRPSLRYPFPASSFPSTLSSTLPPLTPLPPGHGDQ